MFTRNIGILNDGIPSEVQIQKAKNLVSSLEYDVEKYTILLECAKQRRIEIIKSNVNYHMFDLYLREAWEWLNITKPKLKRKPRKKLGDECMYDALVDQMKRYVYKDIVGVTIGNIYECGLGVAYQYTIDFYISYNKSKRKIKRHFVFNVPIIEQLNEKCYQIVSEGRLQLGEYDSSDSSCTIFFSTYNENELYNALVKRLLSEETMDE